MKVAFVTSSVSRQAGGLFFSVRSLARALAVSGLTDVRVLGIEDAYARDDLAKWGSLEPTIFQCIGPSAFGYAPKLGSVLKQSGIDLAHSQGIWMYPSAAVHGWSRGSKRPYLVTPHGMLDPWAVRNSGLKKRVAGLFYENAHLRDAVCLHALCDAEAEAIRDYGLSNPICVIPNGVELQTLGTRHAPPWAGQIPAGERVLLFLGRLHPKKGLPALIEAWKSVWAEAEQSGWHLVIAGWDEAGHEIEMIAEVNRAGLRDRVHFVGPQFGQDKAASYAWVDAFVLPSFSEGLPMTVLEAWSYGLPVLMTDACNLPEGFSTGAALRISPDADALAAALTELFGMSDTERLAMGDRGRGLVAKRFVWSHIAQKMLAVYRWILGQGPQPDCVRTE